MPTVGGEVVFDDCYRGNPLVNVFCLGILPHERLVLARAEGPGNLAVLLGTSTGRDGIGGASVLASARASKKGSEDKRPSVQVGDPFEEKRLIEACLELLDRSLAVGVQDLGAAGLICAASETAANAGAGMDVDIARVVCREPHMNAVEVLTWRARNGCSRSSSRNISTRCSSSRSGGRCAAMVVGRVNDSGRFRVFDGTFDALGVPGDAPPRPHGDDAPLAPSSDRVPEADVPVGQPRRRARLPPPACARPSGRTTLQADDPRRRNSRTQFPAGTDLGDELLALLATPTIADKTWVSRQYDHQLFLNTVVGPGGDAAVLRLKGTRNALALVHRRQGALLPPRPAHRRAPRGARGGAQRRVRRRAADRARQLPQLRQPRAPRGDVAVLRGGRRDERSVRSARHPGDRRERQLLQREPRRRHPPDAGRRRASACRTRSTGAAAGRVHATATRSSCSAHTHAELGGSEWAAVVHDIDGGMPPAADLDAARALHDLVAGLVHDRDVRGVHDCADGGLAVTLAEMAFAGGVGFRVDLATAPGAPRVAPAEACFGESTSRVVPSVAPDTVAAVLARAATANVPAGRDRRRAGGTRLVAADVFDVALADAHAAWRDAIPNLMQSCTSAAS